MSRNRFLKSHGDTLLKGFSHLGLVLITLGVLMQLSTLGSSNISLAKHNGSSLAMALFFGGLLLVLVALHLRERLTLCPAGRPLSCEGRWRPDAGFLIHHDRR